MCLIVAPGTPFFPVLVALVSSQRILWELCAAGKGADSLQPVLCREILASARLQAGSYAGSQQHNHNPLLQLPSGCDDKLQVPSLLPRSVSNKTLPSHLCSFRSVNVSVPVLGRFQAPSVENFQSLPGSSACEQLLFSLSQGLFAISASHVFPSCVRSQAPAETRSSCSVSLTGLIPVSLDRILQTSGNFKVVWGTFCSVSCSFVRSGKPQS